MRIKKIISTVSLLGVVSLVTADVIKNIDINGLKRFSKETVLTYAAISEGEDIQQSDLTHIVANLSLTDFFDDISVDYDPSRQKLIINVKEKPVLSSVTFTGNSNVGKGDIEKTLAQHNIDKGRTFSSRKLDECIRELTMIYSVQGYYDVKIEPQLVFENDTKVKLNIKIAEGHTAKIYAINIHGNVAFPFYVLNKNLSLQPTNVLSFITMADKYSEYKLENDLILLQKFYRENGYPYMTVTDKKITLTPEKKGLVIDIFIKEGDKKLVDSISFNGVANLDLSKLKQIPTPFVYDQKQLDDFEKQLRDLLNVQGYIYGEIRQELIEKDDGTVEVIFKIKSGEKYRIKEYNLIGNITTKDRIVRNFITRPEGTLYSSTDLKNLNEDLNRTGLFSNVIVNPQKLSQNELKIDVNLQEDKTKKIFASAGVSNIGTMWNVGYEDRNLSGTGTKSIFKLEQDKQETVFQFALSNPYITHKNIELYFSFDRVIRDYTDKFMLFKQERNIYSTTVGATWLVSSHTRFGTSANYFIEKDKNSVEVNVSGDKKWGHYLYIGARLFRNMFNKVILPDSGYKWEVGTQASTPLGDYTYTDSNGSLQYFVPFGKTGFLFYQSLSYRMLFPYGSAPKNEIPVTRMLTCGGADDIRGFHFNSIGPELKYTPVGGGDPIYKVLGGNIKFLSKNEIIIPNSALNLDYDQIRFSLFVDVAQMWRTTDLPQSYYNNYNSSEYIRSSGLKATTGVCMRFVSGIVPPITMSANYPLFYKEKDKKKYEFFSFGTSMEF